ncbi:MAG: GNAT family N-acetyltransferase [Anaerolineales bacterium]|nr:GNAT family N-acetyltransferase [Anaerolineales bacterium]
MITIRPLAQLTLHDLEHIASGYTSDSKYAVTVAHQHNGLTFKLERIRLDQPYVKRWEHDVDTAIHYTQMLTVGYSFGAYDNNLLIGLTIAAAQEWNRSLWVWEFHVAETHRGLGIGKQLMEATAEKARTAGFRTLVCETQNTNATAVDVYRKLGFQIEGIDLSYYSNQDYPDGEIAIFMKRRLL